MTDQGEQKRDANYVFYELTRSICPTCRRVVDAQILIRNNKVFMRKRCPDHGTFEGLVYSDAALYCSSSKFNKPGTIPLQFSTGIKDGCPHDCGLCPDHQQHACLGIIEVNSTCDMNCPLCFAEAGPGFNLTLEEVNEILDHLIETEGNPQVVQFSGGEPSIHPHIIPMMRAAQQRGIPNIMLNTNGKRIARDDRFVEELAEIKPNIYFQFDGFDSNTYRVIRGEPDILPEKLRSLDRLASAGCAVILVPAIERGVNEHEIGRIVQFGMDHPAVKGINFQPAFHTGRHTTHNPMERMTNPDILRLIEAQTDGVFGTLGVALHDRFKVMDWITADAESSANYMVTTKGRNEFKSLGIDIDEAQALRRRFAYPCLDWSERRPHIGGALAAALLHLALKKKWITPDLDSRALAVTNFGRREMLSRFDIGCQM